MRVTRYAKSGLAIHPCFVHVRCSTQTNQPTILRHSVTVWFTYVIKAGIRFPFGSGETEDGSNLC